MFCKFAQLRLETRAFWMSERYPSWASLSPRWRCRFRFGKLLASPNKIQHATRTLYNLEGKLPSGHTNGSRALVNPSGDGNGICLCHRGDLMQDHAQPVLHAVSRCTPVAVRPSQYARRVAYRAVASFQLLWGMGFWTWPMSKARATGSKTAVVSSTELHMQWQNRARTTPSQFFDTSNVRCPSWRRFWQLWLALRAIGSLMRGGDVRSRVGPDIGATKLTRVKHTYSKTQNSQQLLRVCYDMKGARRNVTERSRSGYPQVKFMFIGLGPLRPI